MGEAFWLNSKTGTWFSVDEHALWIAESDNISRIGLPKRHSKIIEDLDPIIYRIEVLIVAMEGGLVRIRKQITRVSVEFTGPTPKILPAVVNFLQEANINDPSIVISIRNLRQKKGMEVPIPTFLDLMKEGSRNVARQFIPLTGFLDEETVKKGFTLIEGSE